MAIDDARDGEGIRSAVQTDLVTAPDIAIQV